MNHTTSHLLLMRQDGCELIFINSAVQNVPLRAGPIVFREQVSGIGKDDCRAPVLHMMKVDASARRRSPEPVTISRVEAAGTGERNIERTAWQFGLGGDYPNSQ